MGASIVNVVFPDFDKCGAVGNTISACEYSVAAAALFREHPEDFTTAVAPAATPADVKAGLIVPAVEAAKMVYRRARPDEAAPPPPSSVQFPRP